MDVGYAAAIAISALMLAMSAVMYGLTMRQREDDRRHFLALHREDMARLEAMEVRLQMIEAQPEVEGAEAEVMSEVTTEVSYDPETQVVSFVTPEVEPKTQEINMDDVTVTLELGEWQLQQEDFYQKAMAEIRGPKKEGGEQ